MLIFLAADFHGNRSAADNVKGRIQAEKPDLVLIGGDVADIHDTRDVALDLLRKLAEAGITILYVPGNCDPASVLSGVEVNGVTFLHRTATTLDDVTFIGVGGSNVTPFSTPIEFDEKDLADHLEKARQRAGAASRVVLLAHAPPYNTRSDVIRTGAHVGSTSIRQFIEREQPVMVLCAHIHEARGTDRLGRTIIVNPGPATEGYYALLHIDGEPHVELKEIKS